MLEWIRSLFRRKPSLAPVQPHPQDCEECDRLALIGARYRPPETLLASGFAVACVSRSTGLSEASLHKFAREAGLELDEHATPRVR